MIDWTKLREELAAKNSPKALPPNIQLPVLPSALLEFGKRATDPEVSTKVLAKIVETDAGLSCDLLRHVNSASNGLRREITSVQQAITLCGIRSTNLYLTTCGVKNAMRSSASKLINLKRFWQVNLERALFAREVSLLIGADGEVSYTGSMLQDFLLPLLSNELLELYLGYCEDRESHGSLPAFERDNFGWDHAAAAAKVMHEWGMPDELVCCVSLHHEGMRLLEDDVLRRTSAAAVALSSLLPDPLRQEPDGLQDLFELESSWPEFDLIEIAEKVDAEMQEIAGGSNVSFSLLQACKKAAPQET